MSVHVQHSRSVHTQPFNGHIGDSASQPCLESTDVTLYVCHIHHMVLWCCRWGKKPDGVCLVVGGCARGFDAAANTTADIIYTNTNMQPPGAAAASSSSSSSQQGQLQYFWEAFPAADGFLGQQQGGQQQSIKAGEWKSDARTTYMFSYMDAQVRVKPCHSCDCSLG
jgi:hypothetical protein